MTTLLDRLRDDLTTALRARDMATVTVLRTVLAAIANAEAVPAGEPPGQVADGPIAGAASGLGAAEAARRELGEDEIHAIVMAERDDLLANARQIEEHAPERSADLRASAGVLERYL